MRSSKQTEAGLASQFTVLAGAWLATHRSWNTRAAYEADLAWFADWCAHTGHSPLRVTEADVEGFRADCEAAGSSPASIRRRLAALTSFFDYAQPTDETANPAAAVERPDTTVASSAAELDEGEAREMVASAQELGPKTAALVTLLMLDGLKLGEAVGADLEDLTNPPTTLTVTRQGRPQAVALHATTANAIDAYTGDRTTGPLLLGDSPTRQPARLTRFGADHILKRASAHAGITKSVSANTLRRYYATNAHANGESVDDIRASLGHYDRRTTRRLLRENPSTSSSTPRR